MTLLANRNRNRRAAVVGVTMIAAAVGLALLVGLSHCAPDGRATGGRDPTGARRGDAARPAAAAEAVADPAIRRSLFGQRNVARRRIAGRVSEAGAPVAGARVSLRWAGMEAGMLPPAPVATDAAGRFDLGLWFAERFTVSAAADGKTAAVVEIDLRDPTAAPPPDQLVLVVTPCAHKLVGTVSDGSGGPVAGAAVARLRAAPVATAADGAYALCLAPGAQTVTVTADGYGGVALAVEIYGQVRRDVALVPAGAIRGLVTERRSGAPVADALVSAWPRDAGPDHPIEVLGHTDGDGRFQLGGLAAGRFTVWASTGALLGSAVVAVVPTRAVEVAIAVSDTARVEGRVVANGAPVAGARVFARATARAVGSRAAISQPDGGFALDEVPLGAVVLLAPPYDVIAPVRLTIDRPELSGVVVEVTAAAAIGGRVLLDGQPVAGARVTAAPDELQATSDAQGQYWLRGFKPGAYLVRAEADAGGSPPREVRLAAGEQRANLDLALTSRSSIAGAVVDQDGRPVRDAVVAWSDDAGDTRRATTNDLGEFAVERLRGGASYHPSVRAHERDAALPLLGEPPTIALDARQPRVTGVRLTVQLDRRAISGRVVDAAGAAVADARVDAVAAPRDGAPVFRSWRWTPAAVSDADGGFTLAGLADGSYAVRARAADDREAIASPVAAGARDVALQLAAASAIEVALVGFATTPAVDAQRAGELQNRQGSVDGARAAITGLGPGRYIVTAHNAQELDAAVVELAAGATARVTLTSHGSARVTASVRNFTTGALVAGMQCLVYPTAGGMLGAEPAWDLSAAPASDAEGQAVIDPAPAGPIAVYCYQPAAGLSSARALIELAPGARAAAQLFTVHLEPPGAGDLGVELDQGFPIAITSVRDDGPGARAGIRAGDQLVALDGKSIDQLSKGGVQFWIRSCKVGARVTITVQRGPDAHTVPVVIGAAPP